MTAQQFINDVLVDIGICAAGETPSNPESDFALRLVNQVLDSWSAEALPIPHITRSTVNMTGALSYALGTRPMKIKSADVTGNTGFITSVNWVSAERWADGVGDASHPAGWYDAGYPNATIYIRPAPAAGTLELYTYERLATFTTLSTDLAFPPGYELAIRRMLGLELAHGFGVVPTEDIIQLAARAKAAIAGLNAAVLGTPVPEPLVAPKAA